MKTLKMIGLKSLYQEIIDYNGYYNLEAEKSFIKTNKHCKIEDLHHDYNILVNKDYNENDILKLEYYMVPFDSSCYNLYIMSEQNKIRIRYDKKNIKINKA